MPNWFCSLNLLPSQFSLHTELPTVLFASKYHDMRPPLYDLSAMVLFRIYIEVSCAMKELPVSLFLAVGHGTGPVPASSISLIFLPPAVFTHTWARREYSSSRRK